MRKDSRARTAGLALSVGSASTPIRCLVAAVFLAVAVLCGAAGVVISQENSVPATVVAVLLIEPLAVIGLVAAVFIAAPDSRFGIWLDTFVPRLRSSGPALAAAATLIAVGGVILFLACL